MFRPLVELSDVSGLCESRCNGKLMLFVSFFFPCLVDREEAEAGDGRQGFDYKTGI